MKRQPDPQSGRSSTPRPTSPAAQRDEQGLGLTSSAVACSPLIAAQRQAIRAAFGMVAGRRDASFAVPGHAWAGPALSMAQRPGGPLQAVWMEAGSDAGLMQWDQSITGIRWYYNPRDDTYFYRVDPAEHWYGPDDPIHAGQNRPLPYQSWQLAGAGRVESIVHRVGNYEEALAGGERTKGTDKKGNTFVEDQLPEKYNFEHKGQNAHTHFENTYRVDGAEAVMRENYRSPAIGKTIDIGKTFFASDVFFSQLAAVFAAGSSGQDLLKNLPPAPPHRIVRDTIDNAETKAILNEVNPSLLPSVALTPDMPAFGKVLQTPNGKASFNLLNDFNFINRYRELPAYTISRIEVLKAGQDKDSGWKIELQLAPG